LFASSFNIRVERQRVFDESAIFLVLAPEFDAVAAVAELGTCAVAVGERLFEYVYVSPSRLPTALRARR